MTNTRVDHVLVSVRDLKAAASRWNAAGLKARVGGRHPAGTENVLVRGPAPCYIELIDAPGPVDSFIAMQVRSREGPLSWALVVDDLERVRGVLEPIGSELGEASHGSRTTPGGDTLRWTVCDIAGHMLHPWMPFLISWDAEMEPGPETGPVVRSITLEVPDPPMLAELLSACGLRATSARPEAVVVTDGMVDVILRPGEGSITAMTLTAPGEPRRTEIDGLRLDISPG